VSAEPVATVVVTTHNRPDFARRAVASALAQTVPVEVVVVDDGSEPPFDLEVSDARVRVIRHERAGGVCRARNAGLAVARGAWTTFLDDDDVITPDLVERSVAAATTSNLPPPVAAMSAVVVLDVDGGDGVVLVPPSGLARGEDFFLERRGAAGRAANSLVAPTAVLREIGGWDPDLEAFQHDDLGLRLNAVASIQGLVDPRYRMTTHVAARVSERWNVIPSDMERTLAKHPEAFARHREAHAQFLGALSFYHLKAGHWWAALRWSARAVVRNPADRRLWFFLASAVAGPHARGAYRRIVPKESTVPFLTLMRRRVRKLARRSADVPRAAAGALAARATRWLLGRRLPLTGPRPPRSALLVCIYRAHNAPTVVRLVDDATAHGWEVRLWALDRVAPVLATATVGSGPGPKFPLLDRVLGDADPGRFDWIVVADDDVVFDAGSIDDLVLVAEAAGLDLVQPAHTERSHRSFEFTVRQRFSAARRTTFVEIGPVFAFRNTLTARMLPFPADHTMGWGLEIDWHDLGRSGVRLGIVDGVAVRHLAPVGKGYAAKTQHQQLDERLAARGLRSLCDLQSTVGVWRPWNRAPEWDDPATPAA